MAAKTLGFIFCVSGGAFFAWGTAGAQTSLGSPSVTAVTTVSLSPTQTETPTDSPTPTITSTSTPDYFASPTSTEVWDPWATPTLTPTPNFFSFGDTPVATFTPIMTATYTQTGTITPPDTDTPTTTETPSISRSGLALLPTAYSNGLGFTNDWNWDLGFTYFIGSIAEQEEGEASPDWLNPLRLWLLSSDLKYGWLDENGDTPAIASGMLLGLLISGGQPNSAGQSSTSFELSGTSIGGLYTVASKRLDSNSAIHAGFVLGGLRQDLNGIGLGGFAPSMSYGALLPQFTGKLSDDLGQVAPYLFYTGFDAKMLGTTFRFEFWKPFPLDHNPVLLNSKVDGLFAFNLAYEKWDEGYAVLGYFSFRFTIIPPAPAY